MKLSNFIRKLQEIAKEVNPNEITVTMADSIPVVEPMLLRNLQTDKKVVVITDEISDHLAKEF